MSSPEPRKRRLPHYLLFAFVTAILVVGGNVLSIWLPWHREQLILAEAASALGGFEQIYVGPDWGWLRTLAEEQQSSEESEVFLDQFLAMFWRVHSIEFSDPRDSNHDVYVDDILLEKIGRLEHLKRLSLDNPLITDNGLKKFVTTATSLEILELRSC